MGQIFFMMTDWEDNAASRFIHNKTAATRPSPIERLLKTDLVAVLSVYYLIILIPINTTTMSCIALSPCLVLFDFNLSLPKYLHLTYSISSTPPFSVLFISSFAIEQCSASFIDQQQWLSIVAVDVLLHYLMSEPVHKIGCILIRDISAIMIEQQTILIFWVLM